MMMMMMMMIEHAGTKYRCHTYLYVPRWFIYIKDASYSGTSLRSAYIAGVY
jgi:hypothetical protein